MIAIFIFVLVYSVSRYYDVSSLSMNVWSEWYQYITYNFVHTSFLHLLLNSFVYILYWNELKKVIRKEEILLVSLISASLSGYICASEIQTIGGSAIVFSMLGAYCVNTYTSLDRRTIKQYTTIALFMIIQALINPHINWMLHVVALFLSVLISLSIKRCRTLIKY